MTTLLALVLAILGCSPVTAQPSQRPDVTGDDGVLITEGLVLPGWEYFRSGWHADPVEMMMVQGTWSRPSGGAR